MYFLNLGTVLLKDVYNKLSREERSCMCVYIFVCIHVHIHIYVYNYMYIYVWIDRWIGLIDNV